MPPPAWTTNGIEALAVDQSITAPGTTAPSASRATAVSRKVSPSVRMVSKDAGVIVTLAIELLTLSPVVNATVVAALSWRPSAPWTPVLTTNR